MKGYFFNAQATTDIVAHPSGFDREYDADDFNRYMGLFFTSGVFVRDDPDACKVIATPGAKPPADGISFRPGVVLVDGGQCHIESTDRVIVKPNPLGTAFTSIMCRRNNASDVRGFELVAIGATDDYPFPVREGDIYDMCLAIMDVEPDGTISWVQDTRNDPDYCGYAALTGQPPYYPPEDSNLPYIFWLYTLGYPMTAQQKAAVVGNPSLMTIYSQTRIGMLERGSWARIATYETAGTYTWTAPDLFGDGKAYEIGVWMCGGGGAGGALLAQNRTSDVHMAAGGGSGRARCFKMTVTPGNSYNLVVGAGGAAAAMSTSLFINGNSGGSSAFSGNTVSGGEGGKYVDIDHTYTNIITVPPAMGAQCSIGLKYPFSSGFESLTFNNFILTANPFGGLLVPMYTTTGTNDSNIEFGMVGYPNECFDPFESVQRLGAGGGAICYEYGTSNSLIFPPGINPIGGLGGGAASITNGVRGGDATAPGCGGGGLAYENQSGLPISSRNGAGKAGAVYIYARRSAT